MAINFDNVMNYANQNKKKKKQLSIDNVMNYANQATNLPTARDVNQQILLPTVETTQNDTATFGTFSNGYQPKGIDGHGSLSKTGQTINVQIGESDTYNELTGKKDKVFNKQNVWKAEDGTKWVWDGTTRTYKPYGESAETGLMTDINKQNVLPAVEQNPKLKQQIEAGAKYYKERENQKLFKTTPFDDGYQFGDITKTILGTAGDVAVDVGKGAMQLGQGIGKTGAYGVAQIAEWTGNDEYAEKVRKKIRENPNPVLDKVEDLQSKTIDQYSVLGDKADQILQSVGYTGTLMGVNGLGGEALNNFTMFLSSTGDSISDTLQENPEAENWQVWLRSGANGGVSVLTESLGGIFGNNKVVGNWENRAYKKLTEEMLDGAGKVLTRLGIDAASEAGEEFIEYALNQLTDLGIDGISALAGSDVKFHKDWNWEEVGESMAMAFASTVLLNGSIDATKIAAKKAEAKANSQDISTKEAINMLAQDIDTNTDLELRKSELERTIKTEQKNGNNTTELQNELTQINKMLGVEEKNGEGNITQASQSNISDFNNQVQQTTQEYMNQAQNQVREQTRDITQNLMQSIENYNNSRQEGQEIFDLNNEKNKNELSAIQKVANDRKINIEFNANRFADNTRNAFYEYDNNGNIAKIVLNPNSASKKYVQDLVVHELVHSFSGKQQQKLINDVFNYAKTLEGFDKAYQDIRRSYEEVYGKNVSEDVINEEVVANILGQKLGSKEFINDLVNGKYATQNRNWVQKIYDFVKNQINRFRGYKDQERYWTHIKEMFDDAYRNSEVSKQGLKSSIETNNKKQKQLEIIQNNNPMQDDYHTGIRNLEDIKTFKEAIEDDESFVYGDYTKEDAQRDLEKGTVTVYSSRPIEQGGFVSTSKRMAQDYAGNNEVYSKEVNIDDVAWINGDEGQYAKVESQTSSVDNQGRKLSKEQAEYFKDSKVRDEDGNLLTMYHGTPNGDYTIFKNGSYFTSRKEYADGYQNTWASAISTKQNANNPKTYEVYLNITNPFTLQNSKAKDIYLNEFIKGGNSLSYDPYTNWEKEINQLDEIDWTEAEDLREWLIENHPEYDGLVLDEGGDGGYGEAEYSWRGKSYVPFNSNQIKNVDNTNPTTNEDIRFSKDTSGDWNNFLEKHFQKEGTGTSIKDMKVLPTKQITMQDFEDAINEYNFPAKDANDLRNDLKYVEMNKQSLDDFKDFLRTYNEAYQETLQSKEDEILDTTKTYSTGRKEIYRNYLNDNSKYDKTALEKAKSAVPSKQGRRTKEQWLLVARQIGTEIANKSNEEIEKIAYRSWIDEAPNQKAQLNRQGEKFVKFNSDDWINAIYNQVKDVRQSYSIETNLPTAEQTEQTQQILPTKQESKLPVTEQATEQVIEQDDRKKQRKHYKSIMQSSNMTEEARKIAKELMGSDTYYADSNKRQLKRADDRILRNTPDNELITLTTKIDNGDKIRADDIAVGERLIQYYSKTGDSQKLQEAIQNTAMMGTELGQAVQAMAILNHQTPVGQVSWIQRSVDKMNKQILDKKNLTVDNGRIFNARGKDVTNKTQLFNFTADMQQRILESTSENMNEVLDDVYAELGDQVAQDLQGKIDAWRYFAMLGNLRTHNRNIVGNIGMSGIQKVKNIVAGGIEDVVSMIYPEMERTKTLKIPKTDTIKFAMKDINNVSDELGIGTNKYNPQSRLQQNMRTFKSDIAEKTLGTLFDLNSNLLEVEDGIGLKYGYVRALSDYITANNLTPSKMTENQLAKARKYAIQQAQEATFHQANALATAINQFSRNKFGKAVTDAILPFVKTPLNVAKAGLEYNPVGLVYNSVKGIHDLRNQNITVNQYIDNVSKGLTGTGIALLGYALKDAGILKASGGDDDKDKYEEEQGYQPYSIQIGNQTYTLDWLAPTAIPLFVGAEAHDIINREDNEKTSISSDDDELINRIVRGGSNLLSAGLSSMNPMTEMSMLSGLASAISSYEQDSNQKLASLGANATKSYVNQFIPTFLGQIAKTQDEYQRTTKSTKTGILPKAIDQTKNQIMAKIPGLREQLPIATDVWGNEIEQPENIAQRAVENMILPYTRKDITTTKVDRRLNELYDETGSNSVLPRGIDKTFTIEGQTYRLTNEEYSKYKEDYGQNSYDLIKQFTSSDGYNDLTAEEQQKAIESIYSYAKEKNKIDYADENGINVVPSSLYNVMEDLEENGGSQTDYLEYYVKSSGSTDSEKNQLLLNSDYSDKTKTTIYENTTGKKDDFYQLSGIDINPYLDYKANVNKFEADKDSNGKSISGSKKNKVINYINTIDDLNATQKAILIRKAGYTSFNDYNPSIINYVNSLNITRQEKKQYLEELGFTVDSNFNITW